MFLDKDIRRAYKNYVFDLINLSRVSITAFDLKEAYDIFNPLNSNSIVNFLYRVNRNGIKKFLEIKYETNQYKLDEMLANLEKNLDSPVIESIKNTYQDTICKQFQSGSKIPLERTCRLVFSLFGANDRFLNLSEFSKKVNQGDLEFLKYLGFVKNTKYEICDLKKLQEYGLKIAEIMNRLFDLDELYFRDEDLEREVTFEYWCRNFEKYDDYWTTAVINTNSKPEIIGTVDLFLTDQSFYDKWRNGDLKIAEFYNAFGEMGKISKEQESFLYIDVLTIDQEKITQEQKQNIFFEFRKFIKNKLEMLLESGYNVKSVIAHGYTSFGIRHLLLSGFKKIQHSKATDKHGDPTFLFEKKLPFD